MKAASFLLACLSIFLVMSLYFTQNAFLETFEAKTYDLRFSAMRGPLAPNPEIVIVAIDEKSIAELGRYPWTRSEYARLINKLAEVRVKAIMFDAFFPEHESAKPDQAFAVAAKKTGNVYLATAFDFDSSFQIMGRTGSIPEIENSVKGIAHINFFPEDDGVNRRSQVLIEHEGKFTPSLGVAAAMVALGETHLTPEQFVNDKQIPISGNYSMWVNFMGPAGIYPRYSFADVAAGRIAPELLKDKIVFVGATAIGVYDMRVTPFDGNTPGVETHAAIADNIISGRFIRQSGFEAMIDMAFIVLMGALSYFLTTRLRLYSALPATLILVTGYVWVSYEFFLQGHWVSMVYPPIAAITALMLGGSFRFLVLERSARKMRAMFSSYLSDKLVARLEKDPDAAKLGGANKEVTVLFTDIKGFTTYSEGHTPQEVVGRLNEYLGEMVKIVEQHDGTVDKFIGDGIMVYWGAPLDQPNHAELAIACIRAMKQKMIELRAKWAKEGVEPFFIRGGLQSGVVVAGNVGFEGKKMEYTVIGDTVNQSARLEGTAKYYGVSFLVGENTYEKVAATGRYRELDRIRVVGKQLPVRIYEPAGFSEGVDENIIDRFSAALALYRQRNWQEARAGFAAIKQDLPNDKPTEIYIERCEYFAKNPPPENWDGVFNRDEK